VALLLRCVSATDDASVVEIERLSSLVTDWPRLIDLAARHAVLPLASERLSTLRFGVVPADSLARLRSLARQGALRGLQLTAELVSVVKELDRRGIDALPVKGPTLAALVYRDLSLRLYEDLDVLVHRRDVNAATRVLADLGFTPTKAFDDSRDSLIPDTHHVAFLNASTGVPLELHWSLSHKTIAKESLEDLWWTQRQDVDLGGTTVRTLGSELLVLYLCMHGAKHSWARIGWLCDLQQTLRRFGDIEWDVVWEVARDSGALRMVTTGLLLVDELLGGSESTSRAFDKRPPDRVSRAIAAGIQRRVLESPEVVPDIDFAVQLQLRDLLRDRARYAIHILAEPWPADVAALRLPLSLRGAYYVFRPLRLAWKHLLHRDRRVA
jgi:hypothetical protein